MPDIHTDGGNPEVARQIMALLGQLEPEERDEFLQRIAKMQLDPVKRLSKDLMNAAITLSDREARFLVDSYYVMQEMRKRGRAQERALNESEEPHELLSWFASQSQTIESQLVRALGRYADTHLMGDWLGEIFGIGPVLSAGFLAYIYMGFWCETCQGHDEQECAARQKNPKLKIPAHTYKEVISCPTAGHIWAYAGIAGDGQKPWVRGEKRPWNAVLKTLCWKMSDVQVKFMHDPRCYYGKVYANRKEFEIQNNEAGRFRHIAEARLKRDAERGKKGKEHGYHEKGILSPGHLDLRARRYAVKLFLAHLHNEWYRRLFNQEPPLPYPMAFGDHVHFVPSPVGKDEKDWVLPTSIDPERGGPRRSRSGQEDRSPGAPNGRGRPRK